VFELYPREEREEREERPAKWSLLDLDESTPAPPEIPERDLFDLERKSDRVFPIERAILFSIGAHILIYLFVLKAPFSFNPASHRGLLGELVESERDRELARKIPVVFRSAPGPSRENPRKSDPSDATRRAGGGDPSKARSETPFVPERQGKQDLSPGARAAQPVKQAAAAPSSPASPAEQKQKETAALDALRVPAAGKPSAGREGTGLTDLQHKMEEAARGVVAEPGQGGAGFPNPGGGFVDSGPISFDTTWYDWGAYADEMVRRIKLHWEIPELARLGWKGRLTIRFFIRGDGRVEGAKILSVSGVPPFDFAALQAILTSSPFRPLPKDLGSDREGVNVTFFYNIRPEKEEQGGGKR
jgi:TonB family protein